MNTSYYAYLQMRLEQLRDELCFELGAIINDDGIVRALFRTRFAGLKRKEGKCDGITINKSV